MVLEPPQHHRADGAPSREVHPRLSREGQARLDRLRHGDDLADGEDEGRVGGDAESREEGDAMDALLDARHLDHHVRAHGMEADAHGDHRRRALELTRIDLAGQVAQGLPRVLVDPSEALGALPHHALVELPHGLGWIGGLAARHLPQPGRPPARVVFHRLGGQGRVGRAAHQYLLHPLEPLPAAVSVGPPLVGGDDLGLPHVKDQRRGVEPDLELGMGGG